jgi:hypothetical protein
MGRACYRSATANIWVQMTEQRWHDVDPSPPYGGTPGSSSWSARRARDSGASSRDPFSPRPDAAPGTFGQDRGSSQWPRHGGLSRPEPEPYPPGPYRPAAGPAFYPAEPGSQPHGPDRGRWDAGRREMGRRDAGWPAAEPDDRFRRDAGWPAAEPDDRFRRDAGWPAAEADDRFRRDAGWPAAEADDRFRRDADWPGAEPDDRVRRDPGTRDRGLRNPGTREPGTRDQGRRVPDAYGRDLRTPARRDAGWPRPRSRDWDQARMEQIELRQRGSRHRGSRHGGPGRASPGRRRSSAAGPSWRWGELSGGRGTLIVLAAAVLGTGVTVAMHHDPGYLLGGAVIAGTFVAALAVRREAVYQLIPVPALAYLVGALTAGLMQERSAAPSGTGLAVSATQWVAGGFLTMAAATAVAAAITVIRWLINRHAGASGTPPRPEPLAADRLTSRSGPPSGPEADPWVTSRPGPLPQPTTAPRPEPSFRPPPEKPAPRGRGAPRREPPPPADPYSRRRSAPWPEPPSRPPPPPFGTPRDLMPTSRPGPGPGGRESYVRPTGFDVPPPWR